MLFLLSLATVMLALSATGLPFEQALMLAAAALSTCGPLATVAGTEPTIYLALSDPAKDRACRRDDPRADGNGSFSWPCSFPRSGAADPNRALSCRGLDLFPQISAHNSYSPKDTHPRLAHTPAAHPQEGSNEMAENKQNLQDAFLNHVRKDQGSRDDLPDQRGQACRA